MDIKVVASSLALDQNVKERSEKLPNFTKLSLNSKIPLNPRFWVLAVRWIVSKATNIVDSDEYKTRFLCCPQYVPMTADSLFLPSYTLTTSNGQLKIDKKVN